MDLIQLNKFSHLHDGNKIIFCKTDFLISEFENIKKINRDVILISGNSDYGITDDLINKLPKNVIRWYAQNAISKNERLIPIPIGIENRFESVRIGHGIGYYDRVEMKEKLILGKKSINPTKEIYSNFNIDTNFNHRNQVKQISKNSPHIEWEEPNLTISDFFNKILDYKMVVCPAGNGVDTHRLWEVLYSNRIPITIKIGDFKIYDLYKKLPIIILDSIDQLNDFEYLNKKYKELESLPFSLEELDLNFWIKCITNGI